MKHKLKFVLFFMSFSFAALAQITGSEYHNLNTVFNDVYPMTLEKGSHMYEGDVMQNLLRFQMIAPLVDGGIVYKVGLTNSLVTDDVFIGLEDLVSSAGYHIHLWNGEFIVESAGMAPMIKGTYKIGDTFIVRRCGNVIDFFYQDQDNPREKLKVTFLEDNNFEMDGIVKVISSKLGHAAIKYTLSPLN